MAIFCKDPFYATVWEVKPSESSKYIDLQISTSEKNKDGERVYSKFWPRAIGHAANSLKNLKNGDRILIKGCKIYNEMYLDEDGNKKRSPTKLLIFDAEIAENAPQQSAEQPTQEKTTPAATPTTDEDDPW